MEKYGLSLQKRLIFDKLPRRPKSKFSKMEKYIPTELSPLSEKPKSLGIGLKLVEISCPKVLRTNRHTQSMSGVFGLQRDESRAQIGQRARFLVACAIRI